ncbi:MAG TPA: A/G-specific adenine glycosylase [Acidimicrobiales bacterium]
MLRRVAPAIARDLPWVAHGDPWAVLVSEFMLQQTQTSRVVGPWRSFLDAYPTPKDCADATLAGVLQRWSGLGYHRRAKALHDAARIIRDEFNGEVPSEVVDLRRLPGVGDYTAHAVASFAYGKPVAVLDTNVGRILARALENRSLRASEARDAARALLPRRDSAGFNQAMLDLGAQFCRSSPRCDDCPVAGVCRWRLEGGLDPAPHSAAVSRPQPAFAGSDRQARGRVLAALREEPQSTTQLLKRLGDVGEVRTTNVIASLMRDGLVGRTGRLIHLSRD